MSVRLECPGCRRPLRQVVHRNLHVDTCDCFGMWFDRGELESWLQAAGPERRPKEAAEVERDADPLRCPRCAVTTLRASSRAGIPFARCEKCAGVWLPGEAVARLDPNASTEQGTNVFDVLGWFLQALVY